MKYLRIYYFFLFLIVFVIALTVCQKIVYGASIENQSPSSVVNDATIGTSEWANPNFAQYQDTQYGTSLLKTTSRSSNYLLAQGFNFDIPDCAVIEGVKFEAVVKASGATVRGNTLSLYVDNTFQGYPETINNTAWPTGDTTRTYGSETELWGLELTADQVNDTSFGFALSTNLTGSVNRTAYVNSIVGSIWYHEAECTKQFDGSWLLPFIPTAYASTSCSFITNGSTTTAECTDPAMTMPYQDYWNGLILFFITFFGLLFYFRKGVST